MLRHYRNKHGITSLKRRDAIPQTGIYHMRSWHGPPPPFSNFLFANLFSITFLYFFIISSLFPYFNLFVSIFIQSYVNIKLHVSTLYRYTGTRIPDPLFPHLVPPPPPPPRLWYGSLSGSISLNHLSIFYNISCYNSLVLLTFVSRSSCRITYIIYIHRVKKVPKIKIYIFGTFLTLSLKLMQ